MPRLTSPTSSMMHDAIITDSGNGGGLDLLLGLLHTLRQLPGYTWDESIEPFRSSYDIWHIFGKKQIETTANPTPSFHRLGSGSTLYDSNTLNKSLKDGDRSKESDKVGEAEIKIVARVSLHALREERVFYTCKMLTTTVDPRGHHVVRPLDMMRLSGQQGDEDPIVVCIFEDAGPNFLWKCVDCGQAWYDLQLKQDKSRGIPESNLVAEPVSLQTFLEFAIGAAESVEMLHGQQIVHGEIRGDAFHMNLETGRVKLINLGAGRRTFEHGLTSAGWSAMSKEFGIKTKLSYMSPEQTGRMPIEPDSRTDIFSLGILFWTMLLGKPAFEGEKPMDIVRAVLGQRLPMVSSVRLDIPEVVGRIIQKATAKTVSERYHSVGGLRYDLSEVRRLLSIGASNQLLDWDIGTRDVSPSFILPETMVGRAMEHDAIVKVIDHAFRLRRSSQRLDKHGKKHLPRLSEGHFVGFDTSFAGEDAYLEDDNESSADGRAISLSASDANSEDPKAYMFSAGQLKTASDVQHISVDNTESARRNSDAKSSEKRVSTALESVSNIDSINSRSGGVVSSAESAENVITLRKISMMDAKGRCELITVGGASGLGKSRLIQSVQVEARQRGYVASSKFDLAEKKPFGPVLTLLSSLFQQAFSESNMDPVFLHALRQHVLPSWNMLHKVLYLPEHLLGPSMPLRIPSQSKKQSRGYNKRLGTDNDRPSSSTSSQSSLYSKTLGAQSSQDFLRAGSSTKSLPLMNMFLDILRIFARHKFICFCIDDLHFADEESMELIGKIISTRIKMVIIVGYAPENISSETMMNILEPPDREENRNIGDINITTISLKPLTEDDVMRYVSVTLCRPKTDVFPLGLVIQSKSAGNPFYVREMLEACHRKKCIWYDYQQNGWLFDLDRVFKEFNTDNHNDILGDEFITSRLNELPTASRSVLAWASMLGASFSFELIQRLLNGEFVHEKQDHQHQDRSVCLISQTEQDSIKGLQAAIQAYIVVPTQDDDIFNFAQDRYVQAAALLSADDGKLMNFVMAQTLLKYYPDEKYRSLAASSISESLSSIKSSVIHRQSFRKLLLDCADSASESGLRSTAVKLYTNCIALLQDDMWSDRADDVYYEETLHVYTSAAECFLYRGQYQEAMELLLSVSSNAKTAVDKAPSWILQSRVFAQEGDSTSAFQALKECLVALDVMVDDDPTVPKCDSEFKRLCQEIQSIDADTLVKKPTEPDSNLAAVGAVLVEATSAAFWSDTLTFYQMTLIMVNKFLSSGGFPQSGMGFLQLALIAITRHNMVSFANNCGNIALALIEPWKDPYTIGRGGTIYSTFVGHIQQPLQASIGQMEAALEFAIQAGDRISTILNFGLAGNLKFFVSENLVELESFCSYCCQDIPDWQQDAPGGTMIITIRQVCRALQGKTHTENALEVMSDDFHSSSKYKYWLIHAVKNSDRPLMLYESIEIAPMFLFGHFSSAVALGNSCLKKINAIWSARNSRFLMFFHALSLAGTIWVRVEEQADPAWKSSSSDIHGRSFEAGLQEETTGIIMLLKYFKRRIEQWQAVTDVNYLAWSKLVGAQVAEMEKDHTGALSLYEQAMEHASAHGFVFEEALANSLLGDHLVRLGCSRLAKSALRDAISLYRKFGATGVVAYIEKRHRPILQEPKFNSLTVETGVQTDLDESMENQNHYLDFEHLDSHIPKSPNQSMDRVGTWQNSAALLDSRQGPPLHMLDWTMILEGSQVISSVLQVDQLLKTMCEIILQNCKGLASLAAVAVEESHPVRWAIAASGDPEKGAEAHNPPIPLEESPLIAEAVVNYCSHFRETVFLPDLMQDLRFSNVNKNWLARNPASKSVIAFPICHGDSNKPLLGVLYLEGRPNAFTTRNLEVLQLLVNQIGISYSNALTLNEIERVSAINKSMVDVQKKALSEAMVATNNANIAKGEALRSARLAEEAAKAKTTFLANVSHELRTPLNGVIGNSELLLDSELNEGQAEMADSIRVSADLLLSLINDILDLSKMEAHKMQLHLTAFNVDEMVREMVRSIPIDARNKKTSQDVQIIQDIHLPHALVYGDPVRLRQILGNLISNSLKFTEKGSITVGAKKEWETESKVQLTFWTKDTGIGIPAHQIPILFKPFSQADNSTARKYGGSGLGLSICKSLVESMGGTITLESEVNVGTTVVLSVILPKAKLEESPDEPSDDRSSSKEAHPKSGQMSLSDVPFNQLRVCIAEDNPINQKIALRFLDTLQFKDVDAYDNGLAAVEGIRKKAKEGQPYHIILMDVQMPVMDGCEATEILRKDSLEAVREILIIALTASAVQGDREKCLASGMDDYLAKPVRLAVLKKKFGQYIQV